MTHSHSKKKIPWRQWFQSPGLTKRLVPVLWRTAAVLSALLLGHPALANPGQLYVAVSGDGSVKMVDGVSITVASGLGIPKGIAFDGKGNFFVSDDQGKTIQKIPIGGARTTFVSGLNSPAGLAFDTPGNLYVADYGVNAVLKITPAGVKTIFAASLNGPRGLAFDAAGYLFVAEEAGLIRKVAPEGTISFFASANTPRGLAFDAAGNLFVASLNTNTVLRFTPQGVQSTFASGMVKPNGLAFDTSGNLYVSEYVQSGRILKFPPSGGSGASFGSGLSLPYFLAFEPAGTTLGNISTRLRVETGDNALIGGFIVTGSQPKKVMVRAIGPSLAFADRLANPTLELRNSSGALLEANDDWQQSSNKQAIIDSTIAPTNDSNPPSWQRYRQTTLATPPS
jgi:sugar lactone lactonase YvrE